MIKVICMNWDLPNGGCPVAQPTSQIEAEISML